MPRCNKSQLEPLGRVEDSPSTRSVGLGHGCLTTADPAASLPASKPGLSAEGTVEPCALNFLAALDNGRSEDHADFILTIDGVSTCLLLDHSSGEYTACVAAGVISFTYAVHSTRLHGLLTTRTSELNQLPPSTNLNGAPEQRAQIANSETQVVLSGSRAGVLAACERLSELEIANRAADLPCA
ncbi:hypothetical protein CROQUDRAFT_87314 [Cronartium quercuum f. sp. fusiforme G11]|uniref:[acyl-carrier-protein] S-malonyltransferase n=1 Tax=Cronartium quercuum f. sp. fusiforme G11 TaxID=708437 RepID=A0A9P6TFX6_9BASI|nr:hypothetical protein CROQUDRAFT_87314 [Cronartium quercuum f. sp. fusiforme G11]